MILMTVASLFTLLNSHSAEDSAKLYLRLLAALMCFFRGRKGADYLNRMIYFMGAFPP